MIVPTSTPARLWPTALLAILIAVAFTGLHLRQSLAMGRLSAPPTYDDVTYMADAQRRLLTFYAEGPLETLIEAVREPPHSPWNTALAMGAFMVFGTQDWAPAAVNGVGVAGLLLWLAWRGRELSLVWQGVIAAFLLTWPFAGQVIVHFRPDLACGLVVAWTTLLIARGPWVTADRRRHWLAGVGLALALWIKPTFSPVTLALVAIALAARAVSDFVLVRPRPGWRQVAVSWARCLGVGAVVAAPYYLVASRRVYEYVHFHSFGVFKDVWEPALAGAERWLYYLAGPGGQLLLSEWLYLWAALAVASAVVAWRWHRRAFRAVPAVAAVFLATYVLVTLPAHKNVFLGAALPALMLLTSVEMAVFLVATSRSLSAVPAACARAVPVALLLIGGARFDWPESYTEEGRFLARHEVLEQRALLERVHEILLPGDDAGLHVFFTYIGPYLNPSLLEYRLGQSGVRRVTCTNLQMNRSPAALERELATATHVVAWSTGNPNAIQWLPGAVDGQRILDRLAGDRSYVLLAELPSPGGGVVFVFQRLAGFRGHRALAGWGPIEGPHPQWDLPFPVRWGLGPSSRLEIDVPASGAVRLVLDGTSGLAGQELRLKLGEETLARHRFASREDFELVDLVLELAPGRHSLELAYSHWYPPGEDDDRPRAVLFRTVMAWGAERRWPAPRADPYGPSRTVTTPLEP